MAGALEPEFSGSVAGIHYAPQVNTCQIERDNVFEYIVVWIVWINKILRELRAPRQPADYVLVIWAVCDWIGVIEKFRIIRRGVQIASSKRLQILRIQVVPCGDLSRTFPLWNQWIENVP